MSWFSLIQAEKSVLHSQHFFSSPLTGGFIGEYAVNHILKNCHPYLRIRDTVSQFFCDRLSPTFEKVSPEASEKLLEKIIQGKEFPELLPGLFTLCNNKAQDPNFEASTTTALEKKDEEHQGKITHLINHIYDLFLSNDVNAMSIWVDAFEKGEEALKLIAQKALISGLKPYCNKAINAGLKGLVKKSIETIFDKAFASAISIISVALIYRLALGVLGSLPYFCRQTVVEKTIIVLQNYLPSPHRALTVISAIHITELGHVFLKARNMNLKNTDLNKEKVTDLVTDLVKEPIKKSLKQKNIYKIMNLAFSEEKLDNFTIMLIKETIDKYWDQLHEIRILDLLLVT